MGDPTRRVVVHVGTPKSGTTFLQQALWTHRDALMQAGVRCAGDRQRDMFHAAIEVRGSHKFWGFDEAALAGTWARMCKDARSHDGVTVMSHEVLGGATPEQAADALAGLAGEDVHVVVTARDLARQVTSEWQERIKNGSSSSFDKFQRRLVKQLAKQTVTTGFWRNQDLVAVLDRWTGDLPPENVHVVVAPQTAADPLELWRRFASAVGFDAGLVDPREGRSESNQSLGVAQIEVLRRVNAALDGRIKHPRYGRLVKGHFAGDILGQQKSPRPQCPPLLVARLQEVAEDRNSTIRTRGYTVHGDLDELIPAMPDEGVSAPDDFSRKLERKAYADAIAALLLERAERPAPKKVVRDVVAPELDAPPGRLRRLVERRTRG